MPIRVLGLLLLFIGAAQADATERSQVLLMATGDVTGSYFPAGVALCRVVNEGRRAHGLRCSAEASAGSIANIEALRDGQADLALVQTDVLAAALAGSGPFEGRAYGELRPVLAVFPESVTFVTARGSEISNLEALAGRRVSVGPPGAGQRDLIAALLADVMPGTTLELAPAEAVEALCGERIDAFFYVVGHPARAVQEATSACGAGIAPIEGPRAEAVTSGSPDTFASVVPGGLYAGVGMAVPTVAVSAVLVTRSDVPDAVIEVVAGAILRSLPELAGFDPTLAGLDPAQMAATGFAGPLHPGAQAAFRALGVMD